MDTELENAGGQENVDDYLAMSDEDFAKLDAAFLAGPSDTETEEDDTNPTDPAADTEESEQEEAGSTASVDDDEPEEDTDPGTDDPVDTDTDGDSDDADGDGDERADVPAQLDPKAFYEKVTSEFKANGRNMKVTDPDDVVRLMQMGANYNKKMASLKPNLKMLKTLENAGVLSEDKLNYLIDLSKGNPAAIAKLLKDSKVDPLDMDLEAGDQYKASDYTVDDREMALDDVVSELRDTPTFDKTLRVVSTSWDAKSKQAVADSPQLLKVINDHMASGVYELISTEIEQERMFGRLEGMSDIQAYKVTGDAIQARGGFDHLFKPEQGQQSTQHQKAPTPGTGKQDAARRDKRRAASPSKAAAPSKAPVDFNPLALSDEEFARQYDPRLL